IVTVALGPVIWMGFPPSRAAAAPAKTALTMPIDADLEANSTPRGQIRSSQGRGSGACQLPRQQDRLADPPLYSRRYSSDSLSNNFRSSNRKGKTRRKGIQTCRSSRNPLQP